MLGKPQEAPHTTRVWSAIPTVNIRERRGEILEDNFQNGRAYRRIPMRTRFQNFTFAPNFEPGPPSRLSQELWQCHRHPAVRVK